MKKICKLLLVLLTVISLTACTGNKKEKNGLADLYDQGYEQTMSTLTENVWKAVYQKDYSFENAYKVEIKMDQATYDKLFNIDTSEEAGLKQFLDIIEYLPDCTVTSLNDELPSDDEFSKYVGKTIADMENDGYERSGYTYSEEGCTFYAEGPKYSVQIHTDEVITDTTIDDYSENDIRALTISSVEFNGFSFYFFD